MVQFDLANVNLRNWEDRQVGGGIIRLKQSPVFRSAPWRHLEQWTRSRSRSRNRSSQRRGVKLKTNTRSVRMSVWRATLRLFTTVLLMTRLFAAVVVTTIFTGLFTTVLLMTGLVAAIVLMTRLFAAVFLMTVITRLFATVFLLADPGLVLFAV
jgi:hypothetical protein